MSSKREPGYGEALVGPDGKPIPGNPNVRYNFAPDPELDAWLAERLLPHERQRIPTAGRLTPHSERERGAGLPLVRQLRRRRNEPEKRPCQEETSTKPDRKSCPRIAYWRVVGAAIELEVCDVHAEWWLRRGYSVESLPGNPNAIPSPTLRDRAGLADSNVNMSDAMADEP